MKDKPVVGVTPLWDDEKQSLWMLPGYLDGLAGAGAVPMIFPFASDKDDIMKLAGMCDAFLFAGGHDVSPSLYGERKAYESVAVCEKRDFQEKILLDTALREDKPVLGICRGLQFINAALGGTLYQDLPAQMRSCVNHRQKAPYDEPAHSVEVFEGTPLYDWLGKEKADVNSCHHQGIKELATGLKPMAVAPDGLIEAFYRPTSSFVCAVQWHPEFMFRKHEDGKKIFAAFVGAALNCKIDK